MDVFLSWSGERSRAVAEALKNWIPMVIQAVEPWMSADIEKGRRWNPEISAKLESSGIGIICLTPENLNAPWILFEAGALSKLKEDRVCTFLLGIPPTEVPPPLGQFQHTQTSVEEVFRLMTDINAKLIEADEKPLPSDRLGAVFKNYWPQLETQLKSIEEKTESPPPTKRTAEDMLEEVLEVLRNQERRIDAASRHTRTMADDDRATRQGGGGLGRFIRARMRQEEITPSLDKYAEILKSSVLANIDARTAITHSIAASAADYIEQEEKRR